MERVRWQIVCWRLQVQFYMQDQIYMHVHVLSNASTCWLVWVLWPIYWHFWFYVIISNKYSCIRIFINTFICAFTFIKLCLPHYFKYRTIMKCLDIFSFELLDSYYIYLLWFMNILWNYHCSSGINVCEFTHEFTYAQMYNKLMNHLTL